MRQSVQQDAIKKITDVLVLDKRIKAIFLKGSIARGEDDDYSDVDYYCVVNKSEADNFLEDRIKVMEQYKPLIYYTEANFIAPQIVGVFDNGLHFDLYTITNVPIEGTDAIMTLYDPCSILQHYKRVRNNISTTQIAEYINEFTFRMLEFEAAYCREDLLWASRLGSHLINDLSLVLSSDFGKPPKFSL